MTAPNPQVLAYFQQRLSQSAKLFTLPVPDRAQLEVILTAALRVPDHGKLTPWRLVVLQKPDLERLAQMAEDHARALGSDAEKIDKARGQFDRGHLAVAVIASPKASDKIPAQEQFLSAGALCLNLLHAATAAGWAAQWLSGWPSHDAAFCARAFGCSAAERVVGIIHIATAKHPQPDRPRPALAEVVRWGL